jgi:hypothetical protein
LARKDGTGELRIAASTLPARALIATFDAEGLHESRLVPPVR